MVGSLEHNVVMVAGVGSGLGSAVVSLLAAEGATVIAVARGRDAVEPIEAFGRTRGWKVHSREADVRDPAQVSQLVRSTLDEFGRIDALSLNVGHWVPGETLLHRMTPEQWSQGISDNLDSIYQLGRWVVPAMIERHRGSIVFVSAALAVRWAGSASYCAAKGGIVDLVPKLARDYRVTGVRFNAVLPGSMASVEGFEPPAPGTRVALTDETKTSPWEVAHAIRYLLSDDSRWVTGALVTVDGGASTFGEAAPRVV